MKAGILSVFPIESRIRSTKEGTQKIFVEYRMYQRQEGRVSWVMVSQWMMDG